MSGATRTDSGSLRKPLALVRGPRDNNFQVMNPVSGLPSLAALNPGDLPPIRPTQPRGLARRCGLAPHIKAEHEGERNHTCPKDWCGGKPYPPGVGVGGYYNLGRRVNIEGHRGGLRHGRFHFEDRPGAKE